MKSNAKEAGVNDLERKVVDAVDEGALLEDLRALVATPSHEGRETAVQRLAAQLMRAAGLEVDEWQIDLDELRAHPDFSCEIERDEALGVVGVLPADGAPAGAARDLIFNGHIDVVSPGDPANWSVPPWEVTVRDGLAYGRGTVDMKGGVACALAAARALRDAGVRLAGRLKVETVAGEEDGGLGALATVLRGHRADGAVIVEPTALDVVIAQAGALGFRLTVPGLAAHGAMRWEGVSALEKFLPVFNALRDLESHAAARVVGTELEDLYAPYPIPFPLSIGIVRAGEWSSTVPESLTCEGRYGVMPGDSVPEARRRFESAVAAAAAEDEWLRDHPPRVEWWGGQFASTLTAPGADVVRTLSTAHADLCGTPPALTGVTYGADMRLLAGPGAMPTVLYGPGDVGCAHQPDEHVPLDELATAARVLALHALRFCGVADA